MQEVIEGDRGSGMESSSPVGALRAHGRGAEGGTGEPPTPFGLSMGNIGPELLMWGDGTLVQLKGIGRRLRPWDLVIHRPRGKVGMWNRGMRRRFLNTVAMISVKVEKPLFVSLTQDGIDPLDAEDAKIALRRFLKRLHRIYENAAGMWILHHQKRGAPDIHLVIWNLPWLSIIWMKKEWTECCRSVDPNHIKAGTRVEQARSSRHVGWYLGGYLTEYGGGVSRGPENVGRRWGLFNSDSIPWSECEIVRLSWREFYSIRRAMARIIGYDLSKWGRQDGMTLFSLNPLKWMEMVRPP